ncbi:MAG: hypothetical protein ORN50_03055 [Crocinitomicaceae bacterium]|nr:hypothetical protein [Crocinitomicaceae bacterium]
MASTLTQIAKQKTALEQDFLSRKSVTWLQEKVKKLKSPMALAKEIAKEKSRQGGVFQMGGLYHFFYDPLTKRDLPYYDIFPLVIPVKRKDDGFLGINLHYLPPRYRAIFLDKLMGLAVLNTNNEPQRLQITYEILEATQRYKEFRPCLKHYLSTQIKSKILTVQPEEWETALFLPTANFMKAPISQVYKESIEKANSKVY